MRSILTIARIFTNQNSFNQLALFGVNGLCKSQLIRRMSFSFVTALGNLLVLYDKSPLSLSNLEPSMIDETTRNRPLDDTRLGPTARRTAPKTRNGCWKPFRWVAVHAVRRNMCAQRARRVAEERPGNIRPLSNNNAGRLSLRIVNNGPGRCLLNIYNPAVMRAANIND